MNIDIQYLLTITIFLPFSICPCARIQNSSTDLNQELLSAVNREDLSKIEAILKNDINLSSDTIINDNNLITLPYYDEETPLIAAVAKSNVKIISLLISYGADINEIADSGKTALGKAIEIGNVEIIRLLFSNGAKVILPNCPDIIAIDEVIKSDNEDICALLLEHNNKLICQEKFADIFLIHLMNANKINLVECLFKNGLDISENNDLICDAVNNFDIKIIKLLLEYGAPLNRIRLNNYFLLNLKSKLLPKLNNGLLWSAISKESLPKKFNVLDILQKDKNNMNCLHWFAAYANKAALKKLLNFLKKNCNHMELINIFETKNIFGETIKDIAQKHKNRFDLQKNKLKIDQLTDLIKPIASIIEDYLFEDYDSIVNLIIHI